MVMLHRVCQSLGQQVFGTPLFDERPAPIWKGGLAVLYPHLHSELARVWHCGWRNKINLFLSASHYPHSHRQKRNPVTGPIEKLPCIFFKC